MKDETKRNRFVKNFNYAMQYIGSDNKDMSLIIGCTPETIASWMIGSTIPNIRNQFKLARYLHINPKSLFSPNLIFRIKLLIKYRR